MRIRGAASNSFLFTCLLCVSASREKKKGKTMSQAEANSRFLKHLSAIARYDLLRHLAKDPEADANEPNKEPRQVKSGHYVPVAPTPLPAPKYVAHWPSVTKDCLGNLPDDLVRSDAFLKFFSGDLAGAVALDVGNSSKLYTKGWATGYALSIMGQEYYAQCPFRTGNGYGDGRAMSIFECSFADANSETDPPLNHHFEFQLKGGGRTPYCRGADGRAVLRSSVREFLASEAMHQLGVRSTRALSLIVSGGENVRRPWYSPGTQSVDPDVMIMEPAAISTRVAPSMLRVGQFELFGRRARKREHPNALVELAQLVRHGIQTEYPEVGSVPAAFGLDGTAADDVAAQVQFLTSTIAFAKRFRERLIDMVAGWTRVGYCQGNFNADNCAVGGRTLDYGPFGFMQIYDPEFQPWSGGGDHYAFANQPMAAAANYKMFCVSLLPLFPESNPLPDAKTTELRNELVSLVQQFPALAAQAVGQVYASKLGFKKENTEFVEGTLRFLQTAPLDYTLFFRGISDMLPQLFATQDVDIAAVEEFLEKVCYFYDPHAKASADSKESLLLATMQWFSTYKIALKAAYGDDADWTAVQQNMLGLNPMFVLREFMLVDAYQSAQKGSMDTLLEIQRLCMDPYGRNGSTVLDFASRFAKRTPLDALGKGGVGVMS